MGGRDRGNLPMNEFYALHLPMTWQSQERPQEIERYRTGLLAFVGKLATGY
jgi:hypothetical protein